VPKTRSPARLLIAAAAYLAAGAVVTVLVAFGFGLWGWAKGLTLSNWHDYRVELVAAPGEPFPLDKLQEFGPILRPVLLPLIRTSRRVVIESRRGMGVLDSEMVLIVDGQTAVMAAVQHRTGWPMPALRTERDKLLDTYEWRHAWQPPDWAMRGSYTRFDPRPPLPLRPKPVGFTVNTLFYAGVLWLLFGGTRLVRRVRRVRRGLCVGCGYSRAGLAGGAVCPECGAGAGPAGRGM